MKDSEKRDEWSRWKTAKFGGGREIYHDGLRVERVLELEGEALEEAVRMLSLGVELGDEHAARALAAMASDGSLPLLRQKLEQTPNRDERMALALAVHALCPDQALIEHVLEVLYSRGHWSPRIDAAMALRKFSGERAFEGALRAVAEDEEYLVRYHATESARFLGGLTSWQMDPKSKLFELICEGDGSEDDARSRRRHGEAAELLRERWKARGAAGD